MDSFFGSHYRFSLVAYWLFCFLILSGCHRKTVPPSIVSSASELAMNTHWVRANFHAHSAKDEIRDDGDEDPLQLHRALQQHGVEFSLHSIHSVFNQSSSASEEFLKQQKKELLFRVPGLTIAVGEELTVSKGPHFRKKHDLFGFSAPGNLNHLTLIGIHSFLPNEISLREACTKTHAQGGICIVNHPGPGPMMWEEGLWESKEHRRLIDALEVYNGMAISGFGKEFEERYLEATAYAGLGMQVAAVASADTHGPRSVERARSRLGKLEKWAQRLGQIPALPKHQRPELDAMTLVATKNSVERDLVEALRSRKTVAVYDMGDLTLEFPHLGEIVTSGEVSLQIQFSKPMEQIRLYREGVLIETWMNTAKAGFQGTTTTKAAYVFMATLGSGRLTTSAVWFEPRNLTKNEDAP